MLINIALCAVCSLQVGVFKLYSQNIIHISIFHLAFISKSTFQEKCICSTFGIVLLNADQLCTLALRFCIRLALDFFKEIAVLVVMGKWYIGYLILKFR